MPAVIASVSRSAASAGLQRSEPLLGRVELRGVERPASVPGLATICGLSGPSAPSSSPSSRAGTLNLSSVALRFSTTASNSSSTSSMPACELRMSRPLYLPGPPVATVTNSTSMALRCAASVLKKR